MEFGKRQSQGMRQPMFGKENRTPAELKALSRSYLGSLSSGDKPRAGAQQRRNCYTVGMFAVTTGLLFADQNLLAPNHVLQLSAAAQTFGFTDQERDQYLAGLLAAVFFIVGAPAAIVVGYLMDRHNRLVLLLICVGIGEAPCLATYFVTAYWQLLLTRLLTGIAVGGAAPIIYGLLSDLFPPSQRALVTLFVTISSGTGASLGQAIAGGIPGIDWRLPFVIVSIPALLVAGITAATTRDPPRGGAEPALRPATQLDGFQYDEHLSWSKVADVCRIKTNLLVILQGLPGCLPWGLVMAYLNDDLQSRGLSKQAATLLVMTYGAGGTLGSLIGGIGGQRLYNWRKGALPLLAGCSVWLGMPALYVLVNSDAVLHAPVALLMAGVFGGGAVASVAGVIVRPLIMNVNTPEARGVALALQATLDDLGKGAGPALIAALISFMPRKAAFNVAITGWLLCGLLLCLASLTLFADEAAVQWRLSQVVAHALPMQDGFLASHTLGRLVTPAQSMFTGDTCTPRSGDGRQIEMGALHAGSAESKHMLAVAEDAPLLGGKR